MAKFVYNNGKNASTGHTLFELNCGFQTQISYKEDVESRFNSKSADKLLAELKKLMIISKKNLYHAQKLQKQTNNKGVKSKSYIPGNKVWLNIKFIKTKQNKKLKAKCFKLFQILYPIGKQAYKIELPKI